MNDVRIPLCCLFTLSTYTFACSPSYRYQHEPSIVFSTTGSPMVNIFCLSVVVDMPYYVHDMFANMLFIIYFTSVLLAYYQNTFHLSMIWYEYMWYGQYLYEYCFLSKTIYTSNTMGWRHSHDLLINRNTHFLMY